jgi:hypothetical protein
VNHCISLVKLQRKIFEDFFLLFSTFSHENLYNFSSFAKSQTRIRIRFPFFFYPSLYSIRFVGEFKKCLSLKMKKWNEDNFCRIFMFIFELKSYDVADIKRRERREVCMQT